MQSDKMAATFTMSLKTIIEGSDTPGGRRFDIAVQVLIVLSILTFSIETLPDLGAVVQWVLHVAEVVIVLLFTLEYILRIYVADRKVGYLFSFYGVIDFLAIAPFYILSGVDLRSLRVLRMLRLFRILKLVRYNAAIQRFARAFVIAREEIIIFMAATSMLLYLAAVGIYYFENEAQPEVFQSVFHSLWWAVTTLTTVGYGDAYPITVGGRVFTFFILMIGLGIVAVPAGLLASSLSKVRMENDNKE